MKSVQARSSSSLATSLGAKMVVIRSLVGFKRESLRYLSEAGIGTRPEMAMTS